MHPHVHTHTQTHTGTNTHTPAHAHTHTHGYTHLHTHTCTCTHTWAHTYADTHVQTHTTWINTSDSQTKLIFNTPVHPHAQRSMNKHITCPTNHKHSTHQCTYTHKRQPKTVDAPCSRQCWHTQKTVAAPCSIPVLTVMPYLWLSSQCRTRL